jgi:tripartite-type tricarboxylate transporter receptor subunit TctC
LRLGQPFVIENRSGAAGTIGAGAAAQAAPDGYTVLYDATGLSVTPALFPRLPHDALRDLVPVFRAVTVPQLVLVNPSSPAKDVVGLIELAQRTRRGLDTASDGNGSLQHLVLERFAHAAGVKLNHIPNRGGAPAVNELIAGKVQIFLGHGRSCTILADSGARATHRHRADGPRGGTGRGTGGSMTGAWWPVAT